MDARRERAAVRGARLVEARGSARSEPAATSSGRRWCSIRTSACLTTCAPPHTLEAEQELGRDRPARRDLLDDERLEPEEARELLVEAGLGVVAVDERVGEREPARALGVVDAGVVGHCGGCGPAEVPAGHDVRERVVVDRLVVLVRADHAVDVAPSVGIEPDPRGPVARRLHEEVEPGAGGELLVARPVEVAARPPMPRRPRCAPRARPCVSAPLAVETRVRRRDVAAAAGRFPGEAGARSA